MFASDGAVLDVTDPAAPDLVGTFPIAGAVIPDVAASRVLMLSPPEFGTMNATIRELDLAAFTQVGTAGVATVGDVIAFDFPVRPNSVLPAKHPCFDGGRMRIAPILAVVVLASCGAARSSSPPSSSRPAIGAKGEPSARAKEILRTCGVVDLPRRCVEDRDCAIDDIEHGSCGDCAVTLQVGVTASSPARHLASCKRPACDEPDPLCNVHWHHAEDGPDDVPDETDVVARCVKPAGATEGRCLTQYVARSPP